MRRARLRSWIAAAAAAVALAAGESGRPPSACAADDDAPIWYDVPLAYGSGYFDCAAAGADGTTFVGGIAYAADLPGTTDPDPDRGASYDFVTALDRDGAVVWTSYLVDASSDNQPRRLVAAADGGVWFAGTGRVAPRGETPEARPDSDAWAARFAADGTLRSFVHFGGTKSEVATGFALTADGDLLLSGTTESDDLPGAGGSALAGAGDGFVARLRGDGSGVVWATYLGGAAFDDATALAVDASGDVLVCVRERVAPYDRDYVSNALWPLGVTSMDLVRLSADGEREGAVAVPHGVVGIVRSILPAQDGSVCVGGAVGYTNYGTSDGFVLRLAPDATSSAVLWRERDSDVDHLRAASDGRMLVATREGAAFLLDSDGATETVLAKPSRVRAIDVAPDGTLCLAGYGRSLHFRPVTEEPFVDGTWVARLPASGHRLPSRVKVLRTGEDFVDLAWTRDGDVPDAFEVDRNAAGDSPDYGRFRRVARVSGRARRARIVGLQPGTEQSFRLVAVFPSGVRRSLDVPVATTRPHAPEELTARLVLDGSRIELAFDRGGNGDGTQFRMERQVGSGPFLRVRGPYGGDTPSVDVVTAWGVPVTYRVRAVLPPALSSRWTYSSPIVPTSRNLSHLGDYAPGEPALPGRRRQVARDLTFFLDSDR